MLEARILLSEYGLATGKRIGNCKCDRKVMKSREREKRGEMRSWSRYLSLCISISCDWQVVFQWWVRIRVRQCFTDLENSISSRKLKGSACAELEISSQDKADTGCASSFFFSVPSYIYTFYSRFSFLFLLFFSKCQSLNTTIITLLRDLDLLLLHLHLLLTMLTMTRIRYGTFLQLLPKNLMPLTIIKMRAGHRWLTITHMAAGEDHETLCQIWSWRRMLDTIPMTKTLDKFQESARSGHVWIGCAADVVLAVHCGLDGSRVGVLSFLLLWVLLLVCSLVLSTCRR